MGIVQQVRHDLKAGWARLRFGTAKAANRALEETELLRLRLAVRTLDTQIKDLCRDIGERALEMHQRREPIDRILSDPEVAQDLDRACTLRAERTKLQAEMDLARSDD